MSRLASGLQRLRRSSSPWEVLWSTLASCGLVLFSQLAVAMVPRLFPSLSLLAMLPIAGRCSLVARFLFWFPAPGCGRLNFFFKRQSNSDLPLIACCIGLVFLAAIVLGRLWRRFIGVAASAPLFVLFNILLLWGVYVFVIRRGELLEQCVQCIGRMPIVILDAIDCCGYMLFLSCCIDLSKADKVSWFR
jgi:palmitoyltransferase